MKSVSLVPGEKTSLKAHLMDIFHCTPLPVTGQDAFSLASCTNHHQESCRNVNQMEAFPTAINARLQPVGLFSGGHKFFFQKKAQR